MSLLSICCFVFVLSLFVSHFAFVFSRFCIIVFVGLNFWHFPFAHKILNRPQQMNACSQYKKVLLRFFPPVCPFAPIYFDLVMPRHVLSPCYAQYVHTRVYKGLCNILLGMSCEITSAKHAILYEVTSAKHTWVALEKIWMGANGQTGGKKSRQCFCTDCIHFPACPFAHLTTYRMAVLRVHSLARVEPTATSSPCRRNGVWTGKDILKLYSCRVAHHCG